MRESGIWKRERESGLRGGEKVEANKGKTAPTFSRIALTFFPDVEHDLDIVAGKPGAVAERICVLGWGFFLGGGRGDC